MFVGFLLNSENMTIRLTDEKKHKIISLCKDILKKRKITIREFAQLIGKLVASEPGMEHASLHYKPLEKIKIKELKYNSGDYEATMYISRDCQVAIQWWIDNLASSFKVISHGKPTKILFTDSSLSGWGAFDKTSDIKTGGLWSSEERKNTLIFWN